MSAQSIWIDFLALLKCPPFPPERVDPHPEMLAMKPALLELLERLSSHAPELALAACEFFQRPGVVVVKARIPSDEVFTFTFVESEHGWAIRHIESLFIPFTLPISLPLRGGPALPEEKLAWMRAEAHMTRTIDFYIAWKDIEGTERARARFLDGAGFALAARAWIPHVEPHKAFVLYACWHESRLEGNPTVLHVLEEHRAVVEIPRALHMALYERTVHLRERIPLEEYEFLWNAIWKDRCARGGWRVSFWRDGLRVWMDLTRGVDAPGDLR